MTLIRMFTVTAAALALSACAARTTTAVAPPSSQTVEKPEAAAAPDTKAAQQPKADPKAAPKAEENPPKDAAPKRDARPVPYEDFDISADLPDGSWRPLPPKIANSDADVFIVNARYKVNLYLMWEPYDGGGDMVDLGEIGLKVLEVWAKDDQAVNEAPVSWEDPDGNTYVAVTGTLMIKGQKIRRCFVFRQVSKKYDFAVSAFGLWPEDFDGDVRLLFNGIVDSIRTKDKEPDSVPSDMPLPLPGE